MIKNWSGKELRFKLPTAIRSDRSENPLIDIQVDWILKRSKKDTFTLRKLIEGMNIYGLGVADQVGVSPIAYLFGICPDFHPYQKQYGKIALMLRHELEKDGISEDERKKLQDELDSAAAAQSSLKDEYNVLLALRGKEIEMFGNKNDAERTKIVKGYNNDPVNVKMLQRLRNIKAEIDRLHDVHSPILEWNAYQKKLTALESRKEAAELALKPVRDEAEAKLKEHADSLVNAWDKFDVELDKKYGTQIEEMDKKMRAANERYASAQKAFYAAREKHSESVAAQMRTWILSLIED